MDAQHSELWQAHQGLVKAHNSTAHILADGHRELEQRVNDLEALVQQMAQELAELRAARATYLKAA